MVGYFRRKLFYRSANVNNQNLNSVLLVLDNFDFKQNANFNHTYLKYLCRFGCFFLSWNTNNEQVCNEIDFVYYTTAEVTKLANENYGYSFKDENGFIYVLNTDFLKKVIANTAFTNYGYLIIVKIFSFIKDSNFLQTLFFNLDLELGIEKNSPVNKNEGIKTFDVDDYFKKEYEKMQEQANSWKTLLKAEQPVLKKPDINDLIKQKINTDFWLVYFKNKKEVAQNGVSYYYYKGRIKNWLFKYFFSFAIMSLSVPLANSFSPNLLNELYKTHFHKIRANQEEEGKP